MGQTYHHQFGNMKTTWDFRARNVGDDKVHEKYTKEDIEEITEQIKAYCNLRFTDEELDYLKQSVLGFTTITSTFCVSGIRSLRILKFPMMQIVD